MQQSTQPALRSGFRPLAETSKWIINPSADFFLLQSACGILLLPMIYFANHVPQYWSILFMVWTLAFSLTHQSTTFMRLYLDKHCREKLSYLYLLTPLLLLSVFAILLYGFAALPVIASLWMASQIWHVASQQYGISRRYIRIADSDPDLSVNRLSSILILSFPWLAVSYALSQGYNTLFWYKLALPPQQFFDCVFKLGAVAMSFLGAIYLGIELKECFKGRFVPGRFLCVSTIFSVNSIAWFLIQELSWAYVTVSIWHCLQYVFYAEKFRTSPPPGVQQRHINTQLYAAAIIALSGLCYGLFQLTGALGAVAVAALQFTLAFHHYICDMLIWRRRPIS